MKDTDLYSQIFGLSAPWVVDAVKLNTAEGRVDKHVPDAPGKIVPDCFRLMKHVGEAVDRVRKDEHRKLLAHVIGDNYS